MDGLALLCTLHADGPTTLKRLRAAGCPSLEALLGFEADELARLLGLPAARARRLKREARLLADRMAGELLQAEEGEAREGEPPAPDLASAAPEHAVATAAKESAGAALSGVDRRLLGRVLEHWSHGAVSEGSSPTADADPEPSGRELVPDLIEGLEREHLRRLREAGITTVERLLAADALALSETVGMPFGALRRAQFLGARCVVEEEIGGRGAPAARRPLLEQSTPAGESAEPASAEPGPPRSARAVARSEAPASAPTAGRSEAPAFAPASRPPEEEETGGSAAGRPHAGDAGRTVIDWSFEIPRPTEGQRQEAEHPGGPFV